MMKIISIYVELKNLIESAVALNKERVLFRGVDCRTLGALGMPFAVSLCHACARVFIIERNVSLRCIWRDFNVVTS